MKRLFKYSFILVLFFITFSGKKSKDNTSLKATQLSEISDKPNFIFYLAGVDILKNDKLGRLSMTIKGCNQRDSYILNACKTNNIPLQVSMGGGYSTDIEEIVEAHANTFRLAQEIYF